MRNKKQACDPQSDGELSSDNLVNEYKAAERLGVSVATVRRWRLFRRGPKYYKMGPSVRSSVRYKPQDLDFFIASLPTGGGQEVCA
jgi:hypothetical protein